MNDLPGQWWGRIIAGFTHAPVPHITLTELLIIVGVAVALSIPRITWKYFGLFATVCHELGHAFAALMTGQLVTGIKLNMDHSGTTTSLSRGGLRTVWSGFWGYPVPAVVGLALVWTGFNGWGPAAMSVGAIILAATVLFIRNLTGFLIIGTAFAVSAVLVVAVPPAFTGHVTIALGLALLVGAVRDWLNVVSVHTRRRNELASSDAYILYRRTSVPAPLWLLLFAAVIGGSWALTWNIAFPAVALALK